MRLHPFVRIAVVLAAPVLVLGQYSSSIEGIVTDRSGAIVPNAAIRVTNEATGVTREAITTGDGFYRIVDLSPGTFDVAADHPGFRSSLQRGVQLAGTETVRVNILLDLGSVSEKVTVEAQVPQVETEEGRVSGNITTKDLQELPLNGRNIYNVLAIEPGISDRGWRR